MFTVARLAVLDCGQALGCSLVKKINYHFPRCRPWRPRRHCLRYFFSFKNFDEQVKHETKGLFYGIVSVAAVQRGRI